MTVDPSRHFACETYLLAFAAGAREGFIREHVDRCLFCHDIVHGGSDEFPLSYDEEVALARAGKRRAARRRFLKVGAAAVVGLSLMGGTGLVASRLYYKRIERLQHKREKALDNVFAVQGRPGIETYLSTAGSYEVARVCTWIGERGHAQLLDILVECVSHDSLSVRVVATQQLMKFPVSLLAPFKSHLVLRLAHETDEDQLENLSNFVATIP